MDDRLALMDQGSFLGLRALGHQPFFHATWTYDRPVDLDALRRFNTNLGDTLLGRLVEPSPLPWGRHRWAAIDAIPKVEVEAVARPRHDVLAWTDEFGELGADPEHGPGWRIGVLSLTDGGAAVTMILSHTLGDGLCVLEAIANAVEGRARRPAYPPRGRRRRKDVLWSDLLTFLGDVPAMLRAVAAGIRVARAQSTPKSSRREPRRRAAQPTPRPTPTSRPFHVPVAVVRMPHGDWDAAAAGRGGTSNTLVAAVAARLGERLDRTDNHGIVTLAVPVSVRVEGDTRANALDAATIRINPSDLADDLSGLRAATKAALIATAEQSHDLMTALPLVPLMPAMAIRRGEAIAMGAAASPVGCSNYGEMPAAVTRIDGGDPDNLWVRLNELGQTPADLDRIGGQLYVLSWRALGAVFLSIVAQPVGGGLDSEELHRLVAATLADFGLTAASVTR
ncbi:MAG: hypothetical protein ABIP03_06895 [Aquihabitans sp.]